MRIAILSNQGNIVVELKRDKFIEALNGQGVDKADEVISAIENELKKELLKI